MPAVVFLAYTIYFFSCLIVLADIASAVLSRMVRTDPLASFMILGQEDPTFHHEI